MRPTVLFAMLMIALSSSPLFLHKKPAPSVPASVTTVPIRVEPASAADPKNAKAGVAHSERRAGVASASHANDLNVTAVVYSMPAE